MCHATHFGVTLFVEEKDHEHNLELEYRLPTETKLEVVKMIEAHQPNREILRSIAERGLSQITRLQLENFKARYTKNKYGNATIMLHHLIDWCESHSNLPDQLDGPYVVAHEYQTDRANRRVDCINIMLSSRRLLEWALKRPELVVCDATYKVILLQK